MGLFDGLFGGKKRKAGGGRMVEFTEGIILPEELTAYFPDIRNSKRLSVSITATPADSLSIAASSFGNYPLMPKNFAYPTGYEGKPMFPLAQINFAEVPVLPGYPTSGYLQFFIDIFRGAYGINFDNYYSQQNFRVLFFEESDLKNCRSDFSFLSETLAAKKLQPLSGPLKLAFSAKEEYIGSCDIAASDFRLQHVLDVLYEYERVPEINDSLERYILGNGHKIGGYASFTQEDPRIYGTIDTDAIQLLQIDTDENIQWGDTGVAHFFISAEALARKDFSRVAYHWDCS